MPLGLDENPFVVRSIPSPVFEKIELPRSCVTITTSRNQDSRSIVVRDRIGSSILCTADRVVRGLQDLDATNCVRHRSSSLCIQSDAITLNYISLRADRSMIRIPIPLPEIRFPAPAVVPPIRFGALEI